MHIDKTSENLQKMDLEDINFPYDELRQLLNSRSKQYNKSINILNNAGAGNTTRVSATTNNAIDQPSYREILDNWCQDIDREMNEATT